jgi:ubiquinone/menaquinone biosynthesis C-methylase UbiE
MGYDTLSERLFEATGYKPLQIWHELKDRFRTASNPELRKLHNRIRSILREEKTDPAFDGYDFGLGSFYQDFSAINLSGRRSTYNRIKSMELEKHIKGKKVLDIGTCTGFTALSLAMHAEHITAIDTNPYYIRIAISVAEFLEIKNIDFQTTDFDTMKNETRFDAVLSLSNHFTYNGAIGGSVENYFRACSRVLNSNGALIFESHPPEFEQREGGIETTLETMQSFFDIRERHLLTKGTSLDRDRTFILANKR